MAFFRFVLLFLSLHLNSNNKFFSYLNIKKKRNNEKKNFKFRPNSTASICILFIFFRSFMDLSKQRIHTAYILKNYEWIVIMSVVVFLFWCFIAVRRRLLRCCCCCCFSLFLAVVFVQDCRHRYLNALLINEFRQHLKNWKEHRRNSRRKKDRKKTVAIACTDVEKEEKRKSQN